MNREMILAMPAGRELDALVDSKIFHNEPEDVCSHMLPNFPPYSHSYNMSMEVVEKMHRPNWAWHMESFNVEGEDKPRWFVTYWGDVDGDIVSGAEAEATTLPHAICLVALLAARHLDR